MSGRAVRFGGWLNTHRMLLWIIVALLLFLLWASVPNDPDVRYPGSD